jgi:cytochrome c oxidase subunit 1
MANDIYLALAATIHGTIMVFVFNRRVKWDFSNLLIPLQIGARDMASGFMNMVSYWCFLFSSIVQ